MHLKQFTNFLWVDLSNPDQEELAQVAKSYHINENWTLDCLNPEHLPKLEVRGAELFLTLRAFDKSSNNKDSSVQELTTKIIIYSRDSLLVTIHRMNHSIIEEIQREDNTHYLPHNFIGDILGYVVESFDAPLVEIEDRTEKIEERVYALEVPPIN